MSDYTRGYSDAKKAVIAAAEALLHNVPAEGGDDLDRIGRYSNSTLKILIANVRALSAPRREAKPKRCYSCYRPASRPVSAGGECPNCGTKDAYR